MDTNEYLMHLIEKMLKQRGVKVEPYSLVNNYGLAFEYEGVRYDVRHWLNVYGMDVDYIDVTSRDRPGNGSLRGNVHSAGDVLRFAGIPWTKAFR